MAAVNDLEPLDELAMALGQARHVGAGIPQALEAAERGLREEERNRLLGAASTVQPKLAAILAGIYLARVPAADRAADVHLNPRTPVRR